MEAPSITGTTLAAGASGPQAGSEKLAEGFDQFLSLLTTQLQHQDPLSPLDTNEFTRQLVEFTNVEQAIAGNRKLDRLIDLQSGGRAADAVAYIGREVSAESDRVALQDGKATLTYDLARPAAETRIVLFDADGRPVRSIAGKTDAGAHSLRWDGTDEAGRALPDGVYDVSVLAVDGEDVTVEATTGTTGRVTGVETADGEVRLNLGELALPLADVTAVRATREPAS